MTRPATGHICIPDDRRISCMQANVIGYLGEVHPDVADAYGIGERAYIAVLDMPEVTKYATFDANIRESQNTRQ